MNVHHATHGLSFKLELKQCEIGCVLQDTLVECLAKMSRAPYLVSLELPGLGSDELLGVIANYCENLEVLNIQGSREAVTDRGFSRYVQESGNKAKRTLRQLDVSRCMLTQVTLVHLQELIGTYYILAFMLGHFSHFGFFAKKKKYLFLLRKTLFIYIKKKQMDTSEFSIAK